MPLVSMRQLVDHAAENSYGITLAELGYVEVKDDICNQVYRFDADAVKRLFAS